MARTPTRILVAGLVAAAAGLAGPPRAVAGLAGGDSAAAAARERSVEVRVIEHDGFRWASAGIGALAALGLTLVAAGTAVALRGGSQARNRQTQGDPR